MSAQSTPYKHLMPVQDWLEVPFYSEQLDIAIAHFSRHFEAATEEVRQALVQQVLRESAAESGALEKLYALRPGESRVIASKADGWEEILDSQDEVGARQTFDDLVAALELAVQYVDEGRAVTPSLIREIHQVACRSQEFVESTELVGNAERRVRKPLKHGEFKTSSNYVQNRSGKSHHYCPPELVETQIAFLCEQIRSEPFQSAHPVIQSSYAHYCLAEIHPFDDGNGRVCRVLASLFLMRAYKVPLVVYSDRRNSYLHGLESVQNNDYLSMTQDVADRVAATLSELTQYLIAQGGPRPEQNLADLLGLIEAHDPADFADVEAIQFLLGNEVAKQINVSLERLTKSSKGALDYWYDESSRAGYMRSESTRSAELDDDGLPHDRVPHNFRFYKTVKLRLLNDGNVTDISAPVIFGAGFSREERNGFPFVVAASTNGNLDSASRIGAIKLRYDDCFPTIGTNAILRMQTLAEAACNSMLDRVKAQATGRLVESQRYNAPRS